MALKFRPMTHGMLIAAGVALAFAAASVANSTTSRTQTDPPVTPPASPYELTVAARGLVEPASETIAIAIDSGGVVRQVNVAAGQTVKKGDPLFAIDDRDERAAVTLAEADTRATESSIAATDQNLALQHSAVNEALARVASAEADAERTALDQRRYGELIEQGWTTHQRFETATADARRASAEVKASKAATESARRQIDVLKADRQRAVAELARDKAALDRARIVLDKTVVKAPIDGAILKVNVRLGEFAEQGVLSVPLMTMGIVDPLHVRVDVDETDAQRIDAHSPATAMLPGASDVKAPLKFVRFEPAVVPKRQLAAGSSAERVDTRVLQVIYSFDPKTFPAMVGQQVDVFVETSAAPGTVLRSTTDHLARSG
ncbi:MAG: HlyD family secretion protein [Rhodospirillales bacterium]|nr:HlyD family secretion protein [Rhodospirillales bacterium]